MCRYDSTAFKSADLQPAQTVECGLNAYGVKSLPKACISTTDSNHTTYIPFQTSFWKTNGTHTLRSFFRRVPKLLDSFSPDFSLLISSIFTSHCSNLHFHMHQKISSAKMASFRLASRSSRCVACRGLLRQVLQKGPKAT